MRKKVLLMGKSGSGKTSMRSIIFANYIARDTTRLGVTIDVEHTHLRLLGGLVLNLWDCGGQESYMQCYFVNQRENIFRNVEVLIYIFDIANLDEKDDFDNYSSCLEALSQNSPQAKIFCLVHKTDLIPFKDREKVFGEVQDKIASLTKSPEFFCYSTSIFDETLYKAWSKIVYKLIPNVEKLENSLRQFSEIIEADEVILFERSTFLEIACHSRRDHPDVHRFEKISSIIKQFKLSCSKVGASFQGIELRNEYFSAFIDLFTSNTYIMVVMSDTSIASSATLSNIRNAKKHFEKIESINATKQSAITGFNP